MRPGLVSLLILVLALVPNVALASDPPTWDEPIQIGDAIPSSWFPDINVDPNGKVRMVWSASLVEGDLNESHAIAGAVIYAEETAEGWSNPADIFVMDGGIASRPMIVSDGAWVHLIFRYAPPGVPVRVVYSRAPAGADLHNTHSWSAPLKLTTDESYWTQIRVLPDGRLVVLYNQMIPVKVGGIEERRPALYSRTSDDHGLTWSSPRRISTSADRVARTTLASTADGSHLLAAWDVGYDNMSATGTPSGVATAVSADGGQTWSEPWTLNGEYEQSVVATDNHRALLVYRSTISDRLFYRTSTDGGLTWSAGREVPGAQAREYVNKHNFDKLSLAVDGDGRFLLGWVGTDEDAPKGLSVMVATWDGLVWTNPQVVASPDGFPEYPRLAISLGNQMRVAYFVRDNVFDIGRYTMWIVNGTSDAATIAPLDIEPAPLIVPATPIIPTPQLFTGVTPPPAPAPVERPVLSNSTPQAINTLPIRQIVTMTASGVVIAMLIAGVVYRLARG